MPRPFAAAIQMWATPAQLAAHLAKHDPAICSWVTGITIHHTILPTIEMWVGRRSMTSLMGFYRDVRGWSSGPHLFIGREIWQLTPLNLPGTHGNRCNPDHWGVEVLGSYDQRPWPPALAEIVHGTLAVLLDWRRLPATTINGHRDCGSPKTCPGTAIQLPIVRKAVAQRMPKRRG